MNNFSDDDEKLVDFLRQHHPIPPTTKGDLEHLLMQKIQKHESKRGHSWVAWAIPGAIVGGIMLSWSSDKLTFAPSTMAIDSKDDSSGNLTKVVGKAEDLEIFWFNNWRETLSETSLPSSHYARELDWVSGNKKDNVTSPPQK